MISDRTAKIARHVSSMTTYYSHLKSQISVSTLNILSIKKPVFWKAEAKSYLRHIVSETETRRYRADMMRFLLSMHDAI